MNVNEMSRRQLLAVPLREWGAESECDSLIIIPEGVHDSGFRCMSFIAVKDNEPIHRISGYSDVIHIDGIGGCGRNWLKRYGKVPETIRPNSWSIDCLKQSRCLRLFCRGKITCGEAFSSFEVFAEELKQT